MHQLLLEDDVSAGTALEEAVEDDVDAALVEDVDAALVPNTELLELADERKMSEPLRLPADAWSICLVDLITALEKYPSRRSSAKIRLSRVSHILSTSSLASPMMTSMSPTASSTFLDTRAIMRFSSFSSLSIQYRWRSSNFL